MTDEPFDRLLDRLHAGDETAAGELFTAFEPFLRGLIRRRLPRQARGRFDSIDVVQSAWASLIDGLREARWQFPDAAHLRAFLARVVLCRLYDRANTALRQTGREEPLLAIGANLPGPEARPSANVRADALWDNLLTACPPEHRQVLHLRRDGHSCEDIACMTGMHAGSVRRVLRQLARRIAFDDN
ncbi:MAG TPA: sigma-70 family RNA polymerase sigma factor [Gemmataceae bacterium]|jgi:RNA polymerase sigma-70 factor (ECF subfamily)|nr:sigma-70 family RNA polymerase sigma factor [Gemmataceae bacterium]